jgi:Recombinase zinc beta ribbon domain
VIRDAHEAYITWDEHLELLAAIARNNHLKVFGNGDALLSGLRLLRCGACGGAMVVAYNNPVRRSRGRTYRNTPYTYVCIKRTAEGRSASCQNPSGPHIDRAARELILFALGELNLNGLREALDGQRRHREETARIWLQQVEVLDRRARMLEEAIGDARSAEARTRLVGKFEAVLEGLREARSALTAPLEAERPVLRPDLLKRLEFLKDPANAWERFSQRTRKEIVRALRRSRSAPTATATSSPSSGGTGDGPQPRSGLSHGGRSARSPRRFPPCSPTSLRAQRLSVAWRLV